MTTTSKKRVIEDVFSKIRETCAHAATVAKHVKINEEKVQQFVKEKIIGNLEKDENFFKNQVTPAGLPIAFETIDHEINFWMLYSILQFGSGFRKELHELCGRGASDTMTYGLFSMVLSDSKLNTEVLLNFSLWDVQQHFKIPMKKEQQHPTNPILRIDVDTKLKPLGDLITKVMNECGQMLFRRKYKDFAAYVKDVLSDLRDEDEKAHPARMLVNELVKTFPSLADVGILPDKSQVFLYKRAQLAVAELHKNLRNQDKMFDFPDVNEMTVFVDNVLPAVLVKEGILELDEQLMNKIQTDVKIPAGGAEVELRALAVHACERIIAASAGKITSVELDYYIWGKLGKQKEYREFNRHATTDTVFY